MSSLLLIIKIANIVSAVTKNKLINFDLSLVGYGEDIQKSIDVTDESVEHTTSLTVANTFNFTDIHSTCFNPRITYSYTVYYSKHKNAKNINIQLFEGESTNSDKIGSGCSASRKHSCDTQLCIKDYALTNHYASSSSINITVFVSDSNGYSSSCDDNRLQSTLTLTCTRVLPIICDDEHSCNDMTLFMDDDIATYIECSGENVCSNTSINAQNATDITIECIGSGSCLDMNINAKYAQNVTLNCGHRKLEENNVCHNIYIDVEYAQNIIIAGYGYKALINSTIYGKMAEELDVTCFSAKFKGQTCLNLNIYLSLYPKSNTLNCRFGCERINLYFKNHVDISVFDEMSFRECSLCETIDECIDEWVIYYHNYNRSAIYKGQYNTDYNTLNSLSTFSNHIDSIYGCGYNKLLTNESVDIFSIFTFALCLCMLSIMLILKGKYCMVRLYRKKISFEYVSNKPKLWILLYSICVDILLWIIYIWWCIKNILFYIQTGEYCSDKYQYEEDAQFCMIDGYCRFKDDACSSSYASFSAFCGIMFFLNITCLGKLLDRIIWNKFSGCCICDCLKCRKMMIMDNELYKTQYNTRTFWSTTEYCWTCNKTPGYCEYLVLCIIRDLMLMTFGWVVVCLYSDYDSDYAMKWYDFYLILVLLISKISLQIAYTFGEQYNINGEVEFILKKKFGQATAIIIAQYMPRFYDTLLPSSNEKCVELETMDGENIHLLDTQSSQTHDSII